jgi:hypothetical protein
MTDLDQLWRRCDELQLAADRPALLAALREGAESEARFSLRLAATLIADRSEGNAAGIEEAIALLQSVMIAETDPRLLARAHYHLGEALMARRRGTREEDLETAVGAYEEAMELFGPGGGELELINAEVGLMIAQRELAELVADDKLRATAIGHGLHALDLLRPRGPAVYVAGIEAQLGILYSESYGEDLVPSQEFAIWHLRNALARYDQIQDRFLWANTANLLGVSFSRRRKGDHEDNVAQALHLYSQALEVLKGLDDPRIPLLAGEIDEVSRNQRVALHELDRIRAGAGRSMS